MIRKLGFDDKDEVLDFLCVEAAFNLFLIGDIECYGFENENVVFLGSYDDVGKMNGVLLKFHENFIPYFRDSQFDTQEFRDDFRKGKYCVRIQGFTEFTENQVDLFL